MKTTISIIFFLISLPLFSQGICQNHLGAGNKVYAGLNRPTTSIMITLEPVDKGYGAMANFNICDPWGVYLSVLHGEYWLPYSYHNLPHYKVVAGASFNIQVLPNIGSFLLAGVSYNDFWGHNPNVAEVKSLHETYYHYNKLNHISGEFGMGIIIERFFTTSVRIDPVRGEIDVDCGISF